MGGAETEKKVQQDLTVCPWSLKKSMRYTG